MPHILGAERFVALAIKSTGDVSESGEEQKNKLCLIIIYLSTCIGPSSSHF